MNKKNKDTIDLETSLFKFDKYRVLVYKNKHVHMHNIYKA